MSSVKPALERRTLLAAFLVAVFVRIACLLLVHYRFDRGDALDYLQLAGNLRHHGVFALGTDVPPLPTTFRAPGYPLFLVAVQSVFGEHVLPVQLAQALLTAAVPLLLGAALARVDVRVGRVVLWALAVSPFDAVYAGALISEATCTFFLVLGVTLPFLIEGRRRWLAAGIALGLAALARDVYLLLIPSLAGVALIFARPWIKERREAPHVAAALLIAGSVLAIAPWTVRNYTTFGKAIPVSKGILGHGVWIGTWETNGEWHSRGLVPPPPESYRDEEERQQLEAIMAIKAESERDTKLMQVATNRMRQEPVAVIGRWMRRVPQMWFGTRFDLFPFRPASLERGRPLWFVVKIALFGANAAAVLLGVAGILLTWRKHPPLRWLAVPILYNAAVFFPIHSIETRYSQPVFSLLVVFAAWTITRAADALRRRRGATASSVANADGDDRASEPQVAAATDHRELAR